MPAANTAAPPATGFAESDEREVDEVHCSECGVPISAIPPWYANVAVKFTCDQCRQKSPKLPAGLPSAETESPRALALDPDAESDPAIDDIELDEEEIDDPELEAAVEE